jgi:hypothetical protein
MLLPNSLLHPEQEPTFCQDKKQWVKKPLQLLAAKTVKVWRSVTLDYTHTQSQPGYIHASSFHCLTKMVTEQLSFNRNS